MSDFLRDLVGRTLGAHDVVRPRLASTFESGGIAPPPVPMEPLEVEVARQALSPPPTVRRSVAAVPREVAPAQRESSPAQPPPAKSAASSTTLPQRVEEGAASAAGPAPRGAPVAAVPEPRGTEPAARAAVDVPSVSEPARPPAQVPGRSAPSPRAAPVPEPSAATQPPGPATARARVVKTRVVERRGETPSRAAELPEASERARPTVESAAGAPEVESAEPVVHVHIGRIEVRTPAAAQRPRAPRPREPRLSLDDYLAQSRQGRR